METTESSQVTQQHWFEIYKNYLLTHGVLPENIKALTDFAQLKYVDFRTLFSSLEELEMQLIVGYLKNADKMISTSSEFEAFSLKEKHLAFLYTLLEQLKADQIFLEDFLRTKWNDKPFTTKLVMMLNSVEIDWTYNESWKTETLNKIGLNPRKTALINHMVTVVAFWLNDKSEEQQDTDAFIEKTTDLLFKLTDTSTLESLFDFGKFMFSRSKNFFNAQANS